VHVGASATYEVSVNGSVNAQLTSVGVVDWGRAYATVAFPVKDNRMVLVGWTYVCQFNSVFLYPNPSFYALHITICRRMTKSWCSPRSAVIKEPSHFSVTSS
jgi:hypothetical protein